MAVRLAWVAAILSKPVTLNPGLPSPGNRQAMQQNNPLDNAIDKEISELFRQGSQHYQEGRLQQAEDICLRILRKQHHPSAILILAMIAYQKNPIGQQDGQVNGSHGSVSVQVGRRRKRRHKDTTRTVGKDHPKGQLSGIVEVDFTAVLASLDGRFAKGHEHT